MRKEVLAYQPGRRLVWEPVPASRPADGGRYRWGYELSSDGLGATMVTETFDCSRSPQELRDAVADGEEWRDAMTASLAKLELLATR